MALLPGMGPPWMVEWRGEESVAFRRGRLWVMGFGWTLAAGAMGWMFFEGWVWGRMSLAAVFGAGMAAGNVGHTARTHRVLRRMPVSWLARGMGVVCGVAGVGVLAWALFRGFGAWQERAMVGRAVFMMMGMAEAFLLWRLARLVDLRVGEEAGMCPGCGYDWRETVGRCSECGCGEVGESEK